MLRYLILLLFIYSCGPSNSDCLETLNQNLDGEYSQLLTELTDEFENIIENSEGSNFSEKCINFLQPLASDDTEFYADLLKNSKLAERLFRLDTMIFKYEFIESDSGLTKKYIGTSWNSEYINALTTVKECDDMVGEYVYMITETGGIGPSLIANSVVVGYSNFDLNNPVVKRILAVEILLPHLSNIPEIN